MFLDFHFARFCLNRFSILLLSIILAFALRPFLEGLLSIMILTDIFMSVILLSAVYTISQKRSRLLIGLALVSPCLIMKWANHLLDIPLSWNLAEVFGALFIAYVFISIWSFIARQKVVTNEVIMAAVCGYFLIGFMWAFIYYFLESAQPGSFQIAQHGTGDQNCFIYFSFVTMTTVGYGDITPVSNAGRSLAVLEAVMGQLYLTVTIARLVGAYLSRKQEAQGA